MCVFLINKDFTRGESYFKIEILVKSCSPHELFIDRLKKKKKDCDFGVNFSLKKNVRTPLWLTTVSRKETLRI